MAKQPVPKIMPWSLHKGAGWKSHFQRLERWYERIREAKSKEDISDFIFVFFQVCYQLREWLLSTSNVTKPELEKLFKENVELGICRDICNVTKHFELMSPPRPSQEYEISFAQEYCPPNNPLFRKGWFGGDARLIVITDNKNYDAMELAHTCLCIWQQFLKEKSLV